MNCGCIKHLGCYIPEQIIDFGIPAPYGTEYTFEIWSQSGFYTITESFTFGDPLTLPFTFNENSTTIIKIKLTAYGMPGLQYITTSDGACSFEVNGIIPTC